MKKTSEISWVLPHIFVVAVQLLKKVKMKSLSRFWLFATPWTVAYQAPPSMGFSRQEYWSGLPFPSPGDLPDRGVEPGSPEFQAEALTSEPPGKLCSSLSNLVDCSTPGSCVLHYLLCPPLSPRVCSISCQLSWWCHPTISTSVVPFFSCPLRVFSNESALCIRWPKCWSFSFASVLPMNIQGWFPSGLTGLISLQSKGLSRVFSSTTIQKHQFSDAQPSL